MEKLVCIDGEKQIRLKCTAATPVKYRSRFGGDFLKDMASLASIDSSEALSTDLLLMFFRMTYIMAKDADPGINDDPDEWLEEFNLFDIYVVLPQLIELWTLSDKAQAELKKKAGALQTGR